MKMCKRGIHSINDFEVQCIKCKLSAFAESNHEKVNVNLGGRRKWRIENSEYNIWFGMINRCTNPSIPQWKDWGGRGISVCSQWSGPDGYRQFLKDVGSRPSKGHSIDRINVNGNYEPGNCKWATKEEQNRNKRNNVFLTYAGRTLTVSEWAKETGIDAHTIRGRMVKLGWSVEEALTIKPKEIHRRPGQVRAPVFIEHEGRVQTISQWSKEKNISEDTIYQRHRGGFIGDLLFLPFSMCSAVTAQRNKDAALMYEHNGESRTIEGWSLICGVSKSTLWARMKKLGLTLGEAMIQGDRRHLYKKIRPPKPLTDHGYMEYNGVRKRTRDWAMETGIPMTILQSRRKRGWSVNDIFTTPIRGKSE